MATNETYSNSYEEASQHNLSRLSVCTSSMYSSNNDDYSADDDYVVEDGEPLRMFMSRLSIETNSFDADVELPDFDRTEPENLTNDDDEEKNQNKLLEYLSSSDSDKDPRCYSLPATPPHRRLRVSGTGGGGGGGGGLEYASENEGRMGRKVRTTNMRKRRTSYGKERKAGTGLYDCCSSFSGESDHGGAYSGGGGGGDGGGGVVVITRPKGGRRSLCMDMEEVKACKELGFELEHECMLEVPVSHISVSGSDYVDTSSGGNSPIANFRIPSPGDDPRDVKARLKRWAQAVAFASVSQHHC